MNAFSKLHTLRMHVRAHMHTHAHTYAYTHKHVCTCLNLTSLQLNEILMTDGKVTGVRLSKTGKPGETEVLPCQAVILATGGYSASKEILKVRLLASRLAS